MVSRVVSCTARSGGHREPARAARWLLVGALLMPVGSVRGQTGRHPASGVRAREVPTARQSEWTAIGLGGGGAMYMPAVSPADPRLMLLGCDMSGSYRSIDGGKTWEMIHHRQLSGTTSVRPIWHPTDPDVAFAASGWRGPLKVTRDRGKTWSLVPAGPTEVDAIGIDPGRPEMMLVGGRGEFSRSIDGGRSWRRVGTYRGHLLGIHFDQTSPARDRTCLAATDRGILRSDDGGSSWREPSDFAPGKIVSFAGGSSREGRACALYCSVEAREADGRIEGGIFRSDDRGATWTRAMGPGIDRLVRALAGEMSRGPRSTSSS